MKILQILAGGAWGGGSVVVLAITKALIDRGNHVCVVCLDDTTARRFAAIGAIVVRSPLWFHPINPVDIVPFVQLYLLCLRERYDLVATHTSKGGFLGRLFLWLGLNAIVPPLAMNLGWIAVLTLALLVALGGAGWALWRQTRFG